MLEHLFSEMQGIAIESRKKMSSADWDSVEHIPICMFVVVLLRMVTKEIVSM